MSNVVDRSKLTEGDVCHRCGKDLRTVEEIHVTEGMHFCSKQCTIDHYVDDIITNAKEGATAMYNDFAEVVTPIDIGLVREVIWTLHSGDITVIFRDVFAGDDEDVILSTEVVGFYFGAPEDELTQQYIGKLKATF